MSEVRPFGEYRLFRRIAEDALGETWRGAKISGGAIERVVLLRLFNGAGVDVNALRTTLTQRAPMQASLRNPHLGQGVDAGEVDGVPYLAYEYVPGKPLSSLLDRSREQPFPIPIEQALFMTERVAFGLAAAGEVSGKPGKKLVHGFVAPQWIMLSNEGEVRLFGIEAGPALPASFGSTDVTDEFGPYLSSEVLSGAPATERDDVFSLSAVLFELLTGRKLPRQDIIDAIDSAPMAETDETVPAALRALLKSGVAPPSERIGEVLRWQHSLSRFIAEGEYSPTTFNLAFFMHTLFANEIEQEDQEIQDEAVLAAHEAAMATAPIPAPQPPDVPLPAPPTGASLEMQDGGSLEMPDAIEDSKPYYGTAAKKGLPSWGVGAIAGTLVLALGAVGYFFFSQDSASTAMAISAPEAAPNIVRPEAPEFEAPELGSEDLPPGSEVAAPTQEELERKLEALVKARADEMEASLREQYEAQIETLQQKVEESESTEVPSATGVASVSPTAARRPAVGAAGPGSPDASTPRAAAPSPTVSTQTPGTTAGAAPGQTGPGAGAPGASVPAAAPTKTEPVATKPSTSAATVKVGDLVTPGAGVTSPRLVRRPEPRYPAAAQRLGREATVTVSLLIDENGKVEESKLTGKKAGFGFDDAALIAARRTTWTPPQKDGVKVSMWVDLKIQFKP